MALALVSLLRDVFLFSGFVVKKRCPSFIGSVTSYRLSKCSLHNTPSCGSVHPQSDSIEKPPTQTCGSRGWLLSSTRILCKVLSIVYEGRKGLVYWNEWCVYWLLWCCEWPRLSPSCPPRVTLNVPSLLCGDMDENLGWGTRSAPRPWVSFQTFVIEHVVSILVVHFSFEAPGKIYLHPIKYDTSYKDLSISWMDSSVRAFAGCLT